MPSMKPSAVLRVSSLNFCSSGFQLSTSLSKAMMLNKSPSRRLLSTNLAAPLAWSIFSPLMLPERSTTNTTVFFGRSSLAALISGLASSRK